MRISQGQQQIIDSLVCERLSAHEENLRAIEGFYNTKNQALVSPLENEAFLEDESGTIAYYIVKSNRGKILFYFSLKCGQLYDSLLDARSLAMYKEWILHLERLTESPDISPEDKQFVLQVLERLREKKGMLKTDFDRLPKNGSSIEQEVAESFQGNVTQVWHTFSGIEIVHFCKNEQYSEEWNQYHLPHSIGEVVFWQFIVDIVLHARSYVGCEHLYLFAADQSIDEKLVGYYCNRLAFDKQTQLAVRQPLYDSECPFLSQEISKLDVRRDFFFSEFNSQQ